MNTVRTVLRLRAGTLRTSLEIGVTTPLTSATGDNLRVEVKGTPQAALRRSSLQRTRSDTPESMAESP